MKFESIEESDASEGEDSYDEQAPQSPRLRSKRKYEDIPTDAPKSKKSHKDDLYKPPTVEELNNLRETENLFNNNLFRLQIEELLSETKIKSKRKNRLTVWLESFKCCMDKMPENQTVLSKLMNNKVNKKCKLLSNLNSYEKLFKTDQDVNMDFLKPENIQYFGLYEYDCLPGPNLVININLTMPKECFLIKDYLNNRYIVKRYYYLLYVAEYLKKSDLTSNLEIVFYENNKLLPVISLVPKNSDKTEVLIFASPSEGTFKPLRFSPLQNNLKIDLFDTNLDLEEIKNTPTVFYNSVLAHDVSLYTNNEWMKGILKDQTNIQGGVKLLMIWLKQRELDVGIGAFTETILLYFVVYLAYKKKINKFMSSYQIIRNFWNFLTSNDLLKEPLCIGEAAGNIIESFKEQNDIVLLEKTGTYNVAAFLSKEMYLKIKLESCNAMKYLDDNKNNSFFELFLTKTPFHLQYDVIIDISKSIPLQIDCDKDARYIGYNEQQKYDFVMKTLYRGLNKRAIIMVPRLEMKNGEINRFLIGINLNPEEAFSFIEKGPALNDFSNAADFRSFWGHLATDRRFRDGSTSVAVYFKTNTIKSKRNIVKKIINYLLGEKLKLRFKIHYDEFEDVLQFKSVVPSYPSGGNEETCLKIILAADELGKKLRELNMSLKITGIQGVSDAFTYSDVFPPIPANFKVSPLTTIQGNNIAFNLDKKPSAIPRYVKPIENVIHLEHSSKWPNDLEALRHIKTSFYVEMSKLLKTHHNLLTHPTKDHLDVYFEGVVFRYKIHVPKEVGLMKKIENDQGVVSYRECDHSLNLEIGLNVLPKIVGALRGVQALNPSYGPGTALIKRWLRAHLIDDSHISDIVIDLLNASLFINNNNHKSVTPQISFLRFLKFASEFDWTLQIVTANFNSELDGEIVSEIESKVQNNRNSYPNLFILTPFDDSQSVFTANSPSKEILHRIKQLALESLTFLNRIIIDQDHVGIKEIFIPNFDGYNVLIHLKPSLNPKRYEQITFSSVESRNVIEKYRKCDDDRIPVTDFDPVRDYLGDLRENYGKFAVFFHDSYGGNVIGVLWHPAVRESSDFKVTNVNAGKIDNGKIIFNVDAVIEDFYVMGKDLVKTIEKR